MLTSNVNSTRGNPTIFEPIHGISFDIVGNGIAKPIGPIWTTGEMLRWLGKEDAAVALMESVENLTEVGCRTADLARDTKTEEVTSDVCREIERSLGQEEKKCR